MQTAKFLGFECVCRGIREYLAAVLQESIREAPSDGDTSTGMLTLCEVRPGISHCGLVIASLQWGRCLGMFSLVATVARQSLRALRRPVHVGIVYDVPILRNHAELI